MYDRLEIRVFNKIQDGQNVSIHWHGIQQRGLCIFVLLCNCGRNNLYKYTVLLIIDTKGGTPFEDGPSQIMQCPIKYGSYQVYNFELDRPGTYW